MEVVVTGSTKCCKIIKYSLQRALQEAKQDYCILLIKQSTVIFPKNKDKKIAKRKNSLAVEIILYNKCGTLS